MIYSFLQYKLCTFRTQKEKINVGRGESSVDTRKLDKWADLLLDTGKRNNLINFKDTRVSTVEVLLPSSDALFAKVEGAAFDPP